MATATPIYQVNLEESRIARTRLYRYTDEQKELHARFLGLTGTVTPPVDSLMSQLMLYLQNLPTTAQTEENKIFWEASSFKALMGMHWLIRKEWLDKYKFPAPFKGAAGIAQAKRDTEPMGDVLQALLHLCEKYATVANFRAYPEYVGGARLFSEIVVEIAYYGGIENLLLLSYPIEKTPLATRKEGQSKRVLCRDLNAIVTDIKGGLEPEDKKFFIGQLIAHAVKRAEKSNHYKRGVFKNFTTALRAYVKHLESKKCGLVSFDSEKNWAISRGPGASSKKLFCRSHAQQGFQEQMPNFLNSE